MPSVEGVTAYPDQLRLSTVPPWVGRAGALLGRDEGTSSGMSRRTGSEPDGGSETESHEGPSGDDEGGHDSRVHLTPFLGLGRVPGRLRRCGPMRTRPKRCGNGGRRLASPPGDGLPGRYG